MADAISKELLSETARLITSMMGLYFPEERLSDLERGLISAAKEFGFGDNAEEFIGWLKSSPMTKSRIEMMASHLTVGETYFFREKDTLSAVEERVLSEIIAARRAGEKRLRIWSAGCSTGEEPYTIAIILHRMLENVKDWNVTILATDINPRSLKKARAGVYGEWSFRGSPAWLKDGYFNRIADGGYVIVPFIKDMVTFEYLNLAEDVYPSLLNNTNAMDMIFCRNVLMYFSPVLSRKVVTAFHRSLVDGGFLLVSPTEALTSITSLFVMENYKNATLYRKDGEKEQWAFAAEDHLPRGAEAGGVYTPPLLRATLPAFQPSPDIKPSAREAPAVKPAEKPVQQEKKKPAPDTNDAYASALRMFEAGRFREAASTLEKGLGDAPDGRIAMLLARIHANGGELEDALKWCRQAVAADPLNPYAHYLRASILQEEGRYSDAVKDLKRALYLDARFVLAYFALGALFLKLGDDEAGAKSLKNALDILSSFTPDAVIPESEGITAGRLAEIISSMTNAL